MWSTSWSHGRRNVMWEQRRRSCPVLDMGIPWAWSRVTKRTSGHKGAALGRERSRRVWEQTSLRRGSGSGIWAMRPSLNLALPDLWGSDTIPSRASWGPAGTTAGNCKATWVIWTSGLLQGLTLAVWPRQVNWKDPLWLHQLLFRVYDKREEKQNHSLYWGCFAGQRALGLESDTWVPGVVHVPSLTFSVAISLCKIGLIPASWVLIGKQAYIIQNVQIKYSELKMQAKTFPSAAWIIITLYFL